MKMNMVEEYGIGMIINIPQILIEDKYVCSK
jgi:hypothetical protein